MRWCFLTRTSTIAAGFPFSRRMATKAEFFCTEATRDLAYWMLQDSAIIQEKDVEYVNKRRARQNKKLFEPLYTP